MLIIIHWDFGVLLQKRKVMYNKFGWFLYPNKSLETTSCRIHTPVQDTQMFWTLYQNVIWKHNNVQKNITIAWQVQNIKKKILLRDQKFRHRHNKTNF